MSRRYGPGERDARSVEAAQTDTQHLGSLTVSVESMLLPEPTRAKTEERTVAGEEEPKKDRQD